MTGRFTAIATVAITIAACTAVWAQQSRSTAIIGLTQVTIEERKIDCYISKPPGEGTWPGLVLAHDRMGVDIDTKRLADRLAAEGFVVMAPDLYHGRIALDADKGREMATVLDEDEAALLLAEVAGYLKFQPEVGDHRAGLIGFDLGGRLALLAGTRSSDVSAVAAVYGRPITDNDTLRRINVPIMAVFGELDDQIPAAQVTAFKEALDKAGRTSTVRLFPGARHGFMKQTGETYKPDAANEAWPALIAFLKGTL